MKNIYGVRPESHEVFPKVTEGIIYRKTNITAEFKSRYEMEWKLAIKRLRNRIETWKTADEGKIMINVGQD